jgi:hypothetical protein
MGVPISIPSTIFLSTSLINLAIDVRHDIIRSYLKNRILLQDRGGAEFQTGGILLYVEDLRRGTNKDIGPKDIFEMASS